MNDDVGQDFPVRRASLAGATAFVERFCAANGVAPDAALRLALIAEELLTNTIEHGYGGAGDATVHLRLALEDGHVVLRYDDSAPAFDPLARLAQARPQTELAPEQRVPGGLGIALVVALASSIDYAREGGMNRLRIVLRGGSVADGPRPADGAS